MDKPHVPHLFRGDRHTSMQCNASTLRLYKARGSSVGKNGSNLRATLLPDRRAAPQQEAHVHSYNISHASSARYRSRSGITPFLPDPEGGGRIPKVGGADLITCGQLHIIVATSRRGDRDERRTLQPGFTHSTHRAGREGTREACRVHRWDCGCGWRGWRR